VNQRNRSEISEGYLKAKVDDIWHHNLEKLAIGDVVFHNFRRDGVWELVGVSTVETTTETFSSEGQEYYRIAIDLQRFDHPASVDDEFKTELGKARYRTNKYYPLDKNDELNETYLADLSHEAATYILSIVEMNGSPSEKQYLWLNTGVEDWQQPGGEMFALATSSSGNTRDNLNHTVIAPGKTETLFELYWVFRVLDTFDAAQYRVLADWRESPSTVARCEQDDSRFVLSHDSTGEALTFHEELDTQAIKPDGYLFQLNEVLTRWQTLSEELLNRGGRNSLWGGRPVIVLERFEQDADGEWAIEELFIGEVKYTQDVGYVATGLRELLEYMALVRDAAGSRDYVEDAEDVLESTTVQGLLFTDTLDIDSVDRDDGVRIVEYPESPGIIFGK